MNIVDRGRTSDGSFFIAMQYIDGMSLDDFLDESGREPQAVLQLFAKVAGAVGAAHRQGVVHRDLKPSNIMVDQRGEPHVTDFGLARLMEEDLEAAGDSGPQELTRTGQVLGSLPWLSPEQARGAASVLDARSDVYALGVILYHALVGELPYSSEGTARDLLACIASSQPRPPGELVRGLSQGLDAIVLKALAKSPADRYPNASEVAEDIRRLLAGNRPLAFVGATGRLRHWFVPVMAAISAAFVCLGAARLAAVGTRQGNLDTGSSPTFAEGNHQRGVRDSATSRGKKTANPLFRIERAMQGTELVIHSEKQHECPFAWTDDHRGRFALKKRALVVAAASGIAVNSVGNTRPLDIYFKTRDGEFGDGHFTTEGPIFGGSFLLASYAILDPGEYDLVLVARPIGSGPSGWECRDARMKISAIEIDDEGK